MTDSAVLSAVTRKAGELVAAEEAFRQVVAEAHLAGASLREIERAARDHADVGSRRGFTRERIRAILMEGARSR